MKQFLFFISVILPSVLFAEGGKNLTPANTGAATGANQFIGYLQNGDANNSLSFLAAPSEAGFNPDHRLMIRIKPGETLYYGLQRNDGTGATVNIQLRRLDNGTVVATTNLTSTTAPALNAGAGVIGTYAQMVAGPAAIVGGTGYNALAYTFPGTETAPVDLAVEILDDGTLPPYTASTARDWYNLWDFSVYSGVTEKRGRLHGKYWSFSAAGGTNRLSTFFQFYTAVPNQGGTNFYIKSINLGGMQPFGFFLTTNATGSLTDGAGNATADYKERRKSKNFYAGVFDDGYPQYNNFVNDPDPEFWPSALIVNPVITTKSICHPSRANGGAIDITFSVTVPGVAIVLLDLNGVDGYQPGTKDVLIEANITTIGNTTIQWDGLDGLGANVPSGTAFKTVFRLGSFPIHYPIYDAENNSDGFGIFDERPNAAATPAIVFWDDNNVVANSNQLFGINSNGSVHPWGGSGAAGTIFVNNIGDTRLFNTWIYGQLREFTNTYLHTYNCSNAQPVSNNFTSAVIPQTNGATSIPALNAVDADGSISSYTISVIPPASEAVLTYCSNGTIPCTGTITTVTAGTVLTPAQMATLQIDPSPTFAGTTQFTFTATDNGGAVSNPAVYKVPVAANPPVANNLVIPAIVNTAAATLLQPLSGADADGTISNYTISAVPVSTEGILSYCSNGTEPCTGTVTTVTAGTVLTAAQMLTLKFDPAAGFTGSSVFNYTVTDNSGNISNTASYTIPVTATASNQVPPLSNNITAQIINSSNEATPVPALTASDFNGTISNFIVNTIPPAAQGVLLYCSLAPAACSQFQMTAVTAGQSLTPGQAASIQFDPAPGFSGTAGFTYSAADNAGNISNIATYNIPVVNNPPTVSNITTTAPFNGTIAPIVSISGTDGDGNISSYTIATVPTATQGILYYCPLAPLTCTAVQLTAVTAGTTLTAAQANALSFDPATGFSGTATFSYSATDNNGNISQPGIYNIQIANQPPVAQVITAPLLPNTNGATAIPSLIAADNDGTIASYTIHTLPTAAQGILSLAGVAVTAGQVLTPAQISLLQFDPAAGFTGNAGFTYSAVDNSGNYSNLATYHIPVSGSGNIPPISNAIIAPAMSNNNGATAIPSLVSTDADGTVSSYRILTLPPAFQGQLLLSGVAVTTGQVLTPAQISQLQFDPAAGFTGTATFEYLSTDNSTANSNTSIYSIPVTNNPPLANPVSAPVMPGSFGATAIPALSASDADGSISSYTITSLPSASQGVLLLNGVAITVGQVLTPAQINQLQFDPALGYSGQALFNYFATDNNDLKSNVATYSLSITGVSPVSQDITAPLLLNISGPFSIPALNSSDADGSIAGYSIINLPPVSQGILLVNGVPVTAGQVLTPAQISQLQFDPAAGFIGDAMFNYAATDNYGNISNTSLYIIPVGTGSTLPAEGLSLQSTYYNNVVTLNWKTTSEYNTVYFVTERSTDNVNFMPFAIPVSAAGTSSSIKNYDSKDDISSLQHNGIVYYKVKLYDADGSFKYSNTTAIRIKNSGIKVWPNPFAETVQVSITSASSTVIQLRVCDVNGRILMIQRNSIGAGTSQISLNNLQELLPGIYLLQVIQPGADINTYQLIKR